MPDADSQLPLLLAAAQVFRSDGLDPRRQLRTMGLLSIRLSAVNGGLVDRDV